MLERRMETELKDGVITTWWYVIGDKGAVQFMLMVIKSLDLYLPLDLGVHYKESQFEGQVPDGHCSVINSDCYFQASYIGATALFDRVRAADNDTNLIWFELESTYESIFT